MLLSFLLTIPLIGISVILVLLYLDISFKKEGLNKYNPFIIIYNSLYNYKCSNILANLIIIICLFFIKKLITGNFFIVSMTMQEGILIFFYGVIARVLVRNIIEKLCKEYDYDYNFSDLFKMFRNKLKSKAIISNTTSGTSGPSGVVRGIATGTGVASTSTSTSTSTSDRGTEELVVGQPVVQPVAQGEGQTESQSQSQPQPQDNSQNQNQDQNVDQPLMLTDLDRQAMAGLRPAELAPEYIDRVQTHYRIHIDDVYTRRHKIFEKLTRYGNQIHYLQEDEKKISDPDKKIEISNSIKALHKK
jgi:hypothetical protein